MLAGGRSSRMGVDKASLVLDERTLLQRTVDAVSEVAGEIVIDRVSPHEWAAVDPRGRSFENVNTPAEFEAAVKREREQTHLRARTD